MSSHLINVEKVVRTYKLGTSIIPVLKGINMSVKRGDWVAMLGTSGSGKTTLLNLIGCLEAPDSGRVVYDDVDIYSLSKKERSALRIKKIGFVFQSYHLLPELSVLENVKLPAMFLRSLRGKSVNERAEELLIKVGLKDRLKHRPSEISGGEQQRAAIARALMNDPELILADEPTGNLDSKSGSGILDIFNSLYKTEGKTIIMVTHNNEIANLANRTVVIKDGVLDTAN